MAGDQLRAHRVTGVARFVAALVVAAGLAGLPSAASAELMPVEPGPSTASFVDGLAYLDLSPFWEVTSGRAEAKEVEPGPLFRTEKGDALRNEALEARRAELAALRGDPLAGLRGLSAEALLRGLAEADLRTRTQADTDPDRAVRELLAYLRSKATYPMQLADSPSVDSSVATSDDVAPRPSVPGISPVAGFVDMTMGRASVAAPEADDGPTEIRREGIAGTDDSERNIFFRMLSALIRGQLSDPVVLVPLIAVAIGLAYLRHRVRRAS